MEREFGRRPVNEQLVDRFNAVLMKYSEEPPANDQVIGAMTAVMHEFVSTDEEVRWRITNSFWHRLERDKELDYTYLVNLAVRAVQHTMRSEGYPDYPEQYTTPDAWRTVLPGILRVEGCEPIGIFYTDLMVKEVSSNVSERYKTLQWIGHACCDGEVSLLDIGCSQNHGLLHMAIVDEIPFYGTIINDPDGNRDIALEVNVNRLAGMPLSIEEGLGIDIWHDRDVEMREWTRSSSFRPEELRDTVKVERYNLITAAEDQVLHIKRTDTQLQTEVQALKAAIPNRLFDIVSMFTMLYQLDEEARTELVQAAREHVSPGGLIVVQDGMKIPEGRSFDLAEVEFDAKYFNIPNAYVAIVSSMDGDNSFYELGRYDSGRCREFTFSDNDFARGVADSIRQLPD